MRIRKHRPNKFFLLILLFNIVPDHQYFKKDYVPQKPERSMAMDYQVEDADGFFENLPECKPRKKAVAVGMTKAQKQERKMKVMQMAQQHLQNRMQHQAAAMQE